MNICFVVLCMRSVERILVLDMVILLYFNKCRKRNIHLKDKIPINHQITCAAQLPHPPVKLVTGEKVAITGNSVSIFHHLKNPFLYLSDETLPYILG